MLEVSLGMEEGASPCERREDDRDLGCGQALRLDALQYLKAPPQA